MRPLRLKLRGFTAFRDEQEIDFTELDLFAVSGPIGSGKSSLLDALTYALYGYVDRVGREMSHLISHGQPVMEVQLDFRCGDEVFRLLRRTRRAGGSEVRLWRQEGADFVDHGEGSDKVRDVNRIVVDLVGLDYDAFTRSVVLPQGKFAEFIKGDAAKRREILTELLGLELFGRLAGRANEIAREARSRADTNEGVIAREYSVTQDDARAARATAAQATAAADAFAAAEERVRAAAREDADLKRRAEMLATLTQDAGRLHAQVVNIAAQLKSAAQRSRDAERDLEQSRQSVVDAEAAAVAASAALSEAERIGGSIEQLLTLREQARQLQVARSDLDASEANTAARSDALATAVKTVEVRETALEQARAAHEEERTRFEKAERVAHDARHADLVAVVVAGVKEGDACPVCERPLSAIPRPKGAANLERAERALAAARTKLEAAATEERGAERELARAVEARRAAEEALVDCRRERGRRKERAVEVERAVAPAFPDGIPDEPVGVLEQRLATLNGLAAARARADEAAARARDALGTAERAAERLASEVEGYRKALIEAADSPLIERVHAALPDLSPLTPLRDPLPAGADDAAQAADAFAEDLDEWARFIDQTRGEIERERSELVTRALSSLPDGVVADDDDLDALVQKVVAGARAKTEEAALARTRAEDVERRLIERKKLEEEVASDRREQAVYNSLRLELQGDRIVAFLQAEALNTLAAAASTQLQDLSDGRYRLVYEGDHFVVVDAWNGDEHRSVRTLSGGETFLASLALAVALSQQVQLLAVSERRRLESLFLDEGFGNLDADTLDVVVAALNRLGGEGRLVGVITHIREVADALPVRIEIDKSQRGSRIRVPDAAAVEARL